MADNMDQAELDRARRMAAGLADITLLGTLQRDATSLSREAVVALRDELERRGVRIHPWADLNYLPVSTLPHLDGYRVARVLGIVGSEHPVFISSLRESLVPLMTSYEQRSGALAGTMGTARATCFSDLGTQARHLQADAVLGVALQITECGGGDRSIVLLQATGTAVQLETIT